MPIQLKWADKGVEYCCSGKITRDEVSQADEAVFNDKRFIDVNYLFINALKVDCVEMSQLEIEIDVANDFQHSFKNENIKLAFILNNTALREMAEYYVALFKKRHIDWQVAIFTTMEEAHHWLG